VGEDVSFAEAKLVEVDLRGAKFTSANMQSADLSRANLSRMNLKPYSFAGARFQNADVSEAQGEGVNFQRADLSLGNFRQALLKRANFPDSQDSTRTYRRDARRRRLHGRLSLEAALRLHVGANHPRQTLCDSGKHRLLQRPSSKKRKLPNCAADRPPRANWRPLDSLSKKQKKKGLGL
jgi:hypothetical protein